MSFRYVAVGLRMAWLSEGRTVVYGSEKVQPQRLGRNLISQLQAPTAKAVEVKQADALM